MSMVPLLAHFRTSKPECLLREIYCECFNSFASEALDRLLWQNEVTRPSATEIVYKSSLLAFISGQLFGFQSAINLKRGKEIRYVLEHTHQMYIIVLPRSCIDFFGGLNKRQDLLDLEVRLAIKNEVAIYGVKYI